jgi:hypothetical protein
MPPAFVRTVGVNVPNDDSQDLDVTVTDQNQSGQVVYNQRLAQKTEVFLELQADPGGEASLDWKAVTGLWNERVALLNLGSTRPQSTAISNPVP